MLGALYSQYDSTWTTEHSLHTIRASFLSSGMVMMSIVCFNDVESKVRL